MANQPPVASITDPATGSSFLEGLSVTFSGSATDPEDGSLPGSALAWASSLDGSLGTGTALTRNDLTVGMHDVTLTATDSRGEVGTATVSLTILPSLTGVWAGQDTADFTWQFTLTEDVATGSMSGLTQIYDGLDLALDGGVVTGAVTGSDIELSITFPGYNPTIFAATVSGDRNAMSGVLNGSGFDNEPLTIERTGAAAESGALGPLPAAAPGEKSLADLLRSLSGTGGGSSGS
jgi:hypothetical protein